MGPPHHAGAADDQLELPAVVEVGREYHARSLLDQERVGAYVRLIRTTEDLGLPDCAAVGKVDV